MIDIIIDIFNATAIKCSESILSALGKKNLRFSTDLSCFYKF